MFPNFEDGNLDYHLGAGYIIAYLSKIGVYTRQFTNNSFTPMAALIDKITAERPKIIGFSCYDANYLLIKVLAQLIRKRNPDILIIAGGPTATFSDKIIMRDCAQIDICVRGEGEFTTYEILQRFNSDKNFSKIQGITFRKGAEIIRTFDRPFIKCKKDKDSELDIFPSPYMSFLNPFDVLAQQQRIPVLTARGCVYHCTYCNFSAMSKHTIRYHSIERVIKELKIIKAAIKNNDALIHIMDDVFTLNKKRAKEICRRIIKEKIDLNFWVDTRGDCVDRELLELLFRAGVKEINFGLESAVPKILFNVKKVRAHYKKIDSLYPEKRFISKIKKNVELARKIGIRTTVSAIFGLPGETFKDAQETLNFIKKLKVHSYYNNYLTIFHGTELAEFYEKQRPEVFKNNLLSFRPRTGYDFERLRLHENAFHMQMKKTEYSSSLLSLKLSLMGVYITKDNSNAPKDVILIDRKPPLEWLKEIGAMQTRIVAIRKEIPLPWKKKADNIFSVKPGDIRATCLASMANYYLNKVEYVHLLKGLYRKPQNAVVFDISGNENTGMFCRRSLKSIDERVEFYERMTRRGYFLIDCCRWGFNCPAINMERLIIDSIGNIFVCFNVKPIGRIGDDLGDLRKKVNHEWENEKAKRGCTQCPVNHYCSKCLFTGSLNTEEYCRIKKEYHNILSEFIGSLPLSNINQYKNNSKNIVPFLEKFSL